MGCTSLTVHTIFFLDTSLNRSPVDENVSFTVLSPNFNESIPMTMETNPAYISASLPIRVMRIFLKTYIESISVNHLCFGTPDKPIQYFYVLVSLEK